MERVDQIYCHSKESGEKVIIRKWQLNTHLDEVKYVEIFAIPVNP